MSLALERFESVVAEFIENNDYFDEDEFLEFLKPPAKFKARQHQGGRRWGDDYLFVFKVQELGLVGVSVYVTSSNEGSDPDELNSVTMVKAKKTWKYKQVAS